MGCSSASTIDIAIVLKRVCVRVHQHHRCGYLYAFLSPTVTETNVERVAVGGQLKRYVLMHVCFDERDLLSCYLSGSA